MKIKMILMSALAVLMAACSSNEVKLACTDVDGHQKEVLGVADGEYALEAQGEGDTQTLTLTPKMELKKHLSGITELKAEDVELNEDFGLAICNEHGGTLATLKIESDSAKANIVKVLQGKKGDAQDVKFSLRTDKNKVKEVMKEAKTFKVVNLSIARHNVRLSGSIGKYTVNMAIDIDEYGVIRGAYYYTRMGAKNLLYMKGAIDDEGKVKINEFNIQGDNTGNFDGGFDDDKFAGIFDCNGTRYSYELTPNDKMDAINIKSIPYDKFETSYVSSDIDKGWDDDNGSSYDDEGSVDWDEVLDSYEECVNKAIALMKKVKQNDPTAITEYAEYAQKMQEYSRKLDNAKGQLSARQMTRLSALITKAARANQDM